MTNQREPLTASDIVFSTRSVTPAETAAVSAVLTAAIAEAASAELAAPAHPSAWQRSQRRLRSPLPHGTGAWRTFGS